MHCDTISCLMGNDKDLKDGDFMLNIDKMQRNDYLLQAFAMFVNLASKQQDFDPYLYCNQMIDKFYQQIQLNKEKIAVVLNYQDIENNIKNNMMSALLTIEEGGVCQGDINKLEYFYNRGVRLMTLTWNYRNELACPNIDLLKLKHGQKPTCNVNEGLSEVGIRFVQRMNQLGMVIDLSHSSDKTFYDVIKYSTKPIVCSHSNSRAICDFPRNVTDDMLLNLKDNGGVIGINYCHDFTVSHNYLAKIDDLIDHIDHIKDVIGIDYIGLGSDFDGIDNDNIEMKDADCVGLMVKRLAERGYSHQEIDKITHLNFLRVLSENIG